MYAIGSISTISPIFVKHFADCFHYLVNFEFKFTGGNSQSALTEYYRLFRSVGRRNADTVVTREFVRCAFNVVVGGFGVLCVHNSYITEMFDFTIALYFISVKNQNQIASFKTLIVAHQVN